MLELLVGERVWRIFRLMQMIVALVAVFVLTLALWHPATKALARAEHSGTAMNSIQPSFFKVMIVVGCILYLIQLSANVIRWAQNTDGGRSDGH